jgi:hypothetical protein
MAGKQKERGPRRRSLAGGQLHVPAGGRRQPVIAHPHDFPAINFDVAAAGHLLADVEQEGEGASLVHGEFSRELPVVAAGFGVRT